jgi:hypothetical protein
MRYCIKRVPKVKVDSINLPLRIYQRCERVKINSKIGSGRFRYDMSVLQGLYLGFKWWDDKFNYFGKGFENTNWLLITP